MYEFARSVSQRRQYRACPFRWYARYGLGWQQRLQKAQWSFGLVMERVATAIVGAQIAGADAAEALFAWLWEPYAQWAESVGPLGAVIHCDEDDQGRKITYRKGLSHKLLAERGRVLARLFATELPQHLACDGTAVTQERIRWNLRGQEELAILDYRGLVRPTGNGKAAWVPGIVDFKTADRGDETLLAERDDQLLAYYAGVTQGLHQPVEWVALCRAMWGAKPEIQWVWSPAPPAEVVLEWAHAAEEDNRAISAGKFGRRYGSACHDWGGCWCQPLCFPSQRDRLDTELVRRENAPPPLEEDASGLEF